MPKTLVVLCTFNPHCDERKAPVHSQACRHILATEADLLIADNSDDANVRNRFGEFVDGKRCRVHYIKERVPVLHAFNSALKHIDPTVYDYICYCASDVLIKPDAISIMIKDLESTPDGICISPQVNRDKTTIFPHLIFNGDCPPTEVKIGECVNGHFFLCSKKYYEPYNYKRHDVLVSNRQEPFISYLCKAVGGSQYVSHRTEADHLCRLDTQPSNDDFYDKPFEISYPEFLNRIKDAKIIGFEEIYENVSGGNKMMIMRDKSLWENGTPKELLQWCKDNLFIDDKFYSTLTTETL
jgi:hypothetical protein